MELRRWIQVICILPALQDFMDFRVYSMQCPDTHYLIDKRCCLKCPAGQSVEQHCRPGHNTTCRLCEDGRTYQAVPNGETRCRPCNRQYKWDRKVLKNCTRFHNKEYGHCNTGFYHNLKVDNCEKCRTCPPGNGVKKKCGIYSDTECEKQKCGIGTYSDQDSATQRCTPCTVCKNGEEMFSDCTPSTNYGCRPKTTTTTAPTPKSTTEITTLSTPIGSTVGDKSPTSAGREERQSWVMPFFIAAMVLLLVLFLAFVIGVTIWCHIHSKTRQQNVIIQAEDPIVQRLTKFVDDPESVCLPDNEESRYPYHEVLEKNPARIRENGMMLRDVSHDIIEELANFLNPTNPPQNWRKVASMLDFPWNVINNLALCPTSATQQLLERWGTKRDSTVYKLYLILKEIGRDDAAEVVERLLVQPVPSCPKSI